jgi:uncharacterized protein (DUF2141 family)
MDASNASGPLSTSTTFRAMKAFPGSARALVALALFACAPAGAQGTIRGTVHAPAGEDVRGAIVVACYAQDGRCNYASPHPRSRAIRIDTRGASATFVVRGLEPGEYVILGTRDINANGVEDDGDWVAQEADLRPVRPPAEGIELRFRYRTPPQAAGARRSDPARVPAAPGTGGLTGIYEGVKRQAVAPGAGSPVASGITWTPQRDWMTFFPDGRVHLAMPPNGLAVPFDWEGECSSAPAWCATYTVRGDEVRIRWLSGSERVLHRQSDGSLRTVDRLDYVRHDPLNGRRLEGRYDILWKRPYLTVSIRFARDGRFSEQNVLSNIGWMTLQRLRDPALDRLMSVNAGSGTYAFRENTLELRYDDGRVARIVAYILPQELRKPQPEEIYLSGHDFRRVP